MNSILNFNEKTIQPTQNISLLDLYRDLKECWRNDTEAIKYEFPLRAITENVFEFINGWKPLESSIPYFVSGGFTYYDNGELITYANIVTIGDQSVGIDYYNIPSIVRVVDGRLEGLENINPESIGFERFAGYTYYLPTGMLINEKVEHFEDGLFEV